MKRTKLTCVLIASLVVQAVTLAASLQGTRVVSAASPNRVDRAPNKPQVCDKLPPTLLKPSNGEQLSSISPDFAWRLVAGVSFSRLEISTDSSFLVNTKIERSSHGTGPFDFPTQLSYNLTPDTIYYWRVASACDLSEYGQFSEALSFRTGPVGGIVPASPMPETPNNLATTGSTRVALTFSPLGDATHSLIQFYSTLNDANANVNTQGGCGGSGDYFHPASCYLQASKTYFWRVRLRNAYGWGELSAGVGSFKTPSKIAVATITPQDGGLLTSDGGNVAVQFPPNAVADMTTLSYTLQADPSQSRSGFRYVGRAFSLKAFANGQPVTSFLKPFTLTVQYDPADLLFEKISSPVFLNLYFWNGSLWQPLLPCGGCSIDAANNRIIVVLDHLTEFMLAAPNEKRVYIPVAIR